MNGKTILLISPEPWDGHHVSKHHYAITLSRMGNKVFFLNPFEDKKARKELDSNLTIISHKGHLKGLRFLPDFIQSYFISRDIEEIEGDTGVQFNIIWNFDSSRFYNLSAVRNKIRICHIVDLNQDFKRDTLARTSDYCLCNSDPIFTSLKQHNPLVFKINHGLNLEFGNEEAQLPGKNTFKAVYAGNLDIAYLDHGILKELISCFKQVDFIFIGSYSDSNPLVKIKAENKYLLGKREARELHNYYREADVLLVTYKANKYLEQLANPHKMLEYLYSGKVIVATKTLEYINSSLIITAESKSDFLDKFEKVINNLPHYNSQTVMRERRAFAESNSYEKQMEKIEGIINQK